MNVEYSFLRVTSSTHSHTASLLNSASASSYSVLGLIADVSVSSSISLCRFFF